MRTEEDSNGNVRHEYRQVTTSTPEVKEKETSYVDENGKEIRSTKKGKQPRENIPGYEFVRTTEDPNGNTKHVYEKVTTPSEKERGIFRDTEGNKIPGYEYDMLSPVLDIPEYEYVETVTDPDGTVRHIYKKKTTEYSPSTPESSPSKRTDKVLTTYVDENGELIIPDENGSHPRKSLKGYEIVRTETDANGNVRNVYRKVASTTPEAKVMTTFVDENGNVITPNENGEVPAKDISEYELVRTEKDENGNVRHIYRKVVAQAPKSVETTPAPQEKVTRQELPNTGTGDEFTIFGAAAASILASLGIAIPGKKKED